MNAAQYIEHYQTLSDALPGQGILWLDALRAEAQERFSAAGFPSPREEEWKYTNISPLEKKRFVPTFDSAPGEVAPAWLENHRLQDAWSLVLVDGRFQAGLSKLEGLPESVCATGLANALSNTPERVRKLLGGVLGRETHGFIAFNTAFFSDGALVDIPAGVSLEKSLQILHVSTQAEGLANTRSLISLGANASAKLIETYVGTAEVGHLTASVAEVGLGENAGLDFYKVQTEAEKAYHFGGVYVRQERYSRFNQHNFSLGGLLARTDIRTELALGCECELNGLFLAQNRQHVDNHTLIHHAEPQGISRENYRGVLADRARGVFQGRIVVHPKAQKTHSEMNNRNLLLSDDAEIDTKPQLEILADDVKCSHGVAIGQLDPESVFYLESRGVDRESARNMLTFAFAHAMVEKIGLDSLRHQVQEHLLSRFPQAGIRRDWL